MSRKDGLGCRIATLLVAAWMGLVGWMLPGSVLAQTNGYGPPFYLSGSGDDGSHAKYPTFMAAVTVVRNALIAQNGPPAAKCPLLFTINNPPIPESSGQELMGNIQYPLFCPINVGYIYASGSPYALGKSVGGCDCDGGIGHDENGEAPTCGPLSTGACP